MLWKEEAFYEAAFVKPVMRNYFVPGSFAVVAHRQHTLAVRHDTKFRGVFLIFGGETLGSRPTCGSMVHFGEITGRTMVEAGYEVTLSSTCPSRKPEAIAILDFFLL
jgi:hypothetical protein